MWKSNTCDRISPVESSNAHFAIKTQVSDSKVNQIILDCVLSIKLKGEPEDDEEMLAED
jgi:hypothetical protein